MSDDITFCADSFDDCDKRKCERHKANIRLFWLNHSFAHLKGTKFCELQEENETEDGNNGEKTCKRRGNMRK